MKPKIDIPKDILINLYVTRKLSLAEAGEAYGVSSFTIRERLIDNGIKIRRHGPLSPSTAGDLDTLNDEEKADLKDLLTNLYRNCGSLRKLASRYRMSTTKLCRYFDALNIQRKGKGGPARFADRTEKIIELHKQNMTIREIAKTIGMNYITVYKYLQKANVRTTPRRKYKKRALKT